MIDHDDDDRPREVDEPSDWDSLWAKPKRELVDEIRDLRHDLEAANAEIAARDADTEKSENTPDPTLIATGGWCAPSDTIYQPLPDVTVRRGGLAFTPGPRWGEHPWSKMSKKKLIRALEKADRKLTKEQSRRRKAENKARRLLDIIRDLV